MEQVTMATENLRKRFDQVLKLIYSTLSVTRTPDNSNFQ